MRAKHPRHFPDFRRKVLPLVIAAAAALTTTAYAAKGPTIQLFPTNVLENIKQTGEAAQSMEVGLQPIVAEMDTQQELYQQAKCEGAEGDPGCADIRNRLFSTYQKMLESMNEHLPAMQQSIGHTKTALEKNLSKELGRKMSPWKLQEELTKNGKSNGGRKALALRGRSGLRLSSKFKQYYDLVSTSGTSLSGSSMAVAASDVYLDMVDTQDLIGMIQDEISRAAIYGQVQQAFGEITPEMMNVVSRVKTVLFGESDDVDGLAPEPPPGNTPEEYRSPLER